MGFIKAVAKGLWLRLSIVGATGHGKTFTALKIAKRFLEASGAENQIPAFADTERSSALRYAPKPGELANEEHGTFDFAHMQIEQPYHPEKFVKAVQEAVKAGFSLIIIDSLSHAWSGPGGLLEIKDQITAASRTKNSYQAWAETTPIQNKMIDAITRAPIHIIVCMRQKMDYAMEQNEKGKQTPVRIGMGNIQRDDLPYEFDVELQMLNPQNWAEVTKTRCHLLSGYRVEKPGADLAERLAFWLNGMGMLAQDVSAMALEGSGRPQDPISRLVAGSRHLQSLLSAQGIEAVKAELRRMGYTTLGQLQAITGADVDAAFGLESTASEDALSALMEG